MGPPLQENCRLFATWYEDLAVKDDTTVEGARKLYHAAANRLQAVVEVLARRKDKPPRLRTLEAPVAPETNPAMAQLLIHCRSPLFK